MFVEMLHSPAVVRQLGEGPIILYEVFQTFQPGLNLTRGVFDCDPISKHVNMSWNLLRWPQAYFSARRRIQGDVRLR